MEEERNRSSVSNQQTQTGGYNQNVNQYPYDRQYTYDRQQPYCSQYPYDSIPLFQTLQWIIQIQM